VRLSPWSIVRQPEHWMHTVNTMHWWKEKLQMKTEVLGRKPVPLILPTTYPTWTVPGSNPALRGEKSA
jgi:hypothetical protein